MQSYLEPDGGLYDPTKRFAFTNITASPFTSRWGGVPITVQAGDTIEVSNTTPIPGAGHALALKMTKEMVDSIMMDEAKMDEMAHEDNPYYRSPKGTMMGVPSARKVYEDQILRELDPDEESPAIQHIRKQILAEIQTGVDEKQSTAPVHIPTSLEEFADIKNKPQVIEQKPAKVKKMGRPRKNETTLSHSTA